MMHSTLLAVSGKERTAEQATDLMQIGDHGFMGMGYFIVVFVCSV